MTTAPDAPAPTVGDLEAWIRDVGYLGRLEQHATAAAIVLNVGRRWHWLVLPGQDGFVLGRLRHQQESVAVVATPAEVAEALAFFGLLNPQPAET